MTPIRWHGRTIGAAAIVVTLASSLWVAPASAQMFREPFSFNSRNAAGMAVFMRQREDADAAAAALADGGGNIGHTLVCAGTGTTAATSAGNIMCVLAGDGANVIVNGDQDSTGDQTSDADTTQTAADTIQGILDGEDDQ
jgi:hypothetical protein